MSPTFFNYLSICRRAIHDFVKELNDAELPIKNADSENSGKSENEDVA
jgi:hypothetical protein